MKKETDWEGTPENIDNYQGFVYEIYDSKKGKYYIGKKNFWKVIKRKPLKGKKRRRLDTIQTNWKTYKTSNTLVQEALIERPETCVCKMIKLCESKTDMAIWETYLQLQVYIEGRWYLYYNQMINMRCNIRK